MSTATSYGRTLARAELVDAQQLVISVQRLSFEVTQLRRDLTAATELLARLKTAHVRHVTETHAGWSVTPAAAIAAAPAKLPLRGGPRRAAR